MQAGLDVSLNNNFSGGGIYGAPAGIFAPQVSHVTLFAPEPGWNPFAAYMPTHIASVYSAPAVIPTAAVGKNPWDTTFGPIGVGAAHGAISVPALALAPQVGSSSFG